MADTDVVEMLKRSMAESRHINSTERGSCIQPLMRYVKLKSVLNIDKIFDWILNFTSEVESIWKTKWNVIKILYLTTRYVPLAFIPLDLSYIFTPSLSVSGCIAVYDTITVLYIIGLLAAECIFTIRTVAVWGKDKHVTYILFATFSAMCIVIPTLIGINLSRTSRRFIDVIFILFNDPPSRQKDWSGSESLSKDSARQFSGTSYKFLVATFAFTAAYDTMILTFMVARAFSMSRWRVDSFLFKTVYGDGVAFYIYIFGVSLVNIIFIFTTNSFFLLLQASFHSILACRVVLHIREQLSEADSKEVSLDGSRRRLNPRIRTRSQLST
ncbi:hypothetical protein AGABI1DRAFT_132605 [Agaricus bisporus var. burnettii JB137-S8]|uniref:DUF6533 domain-containing protein n=1 Tax=Agaricus bisporus var. burnettii (strain JB137-S8 / ATCC MYA-4627 / FGSC 10392) TaxID=597362 RepID=K5WWZ4_AGABU|nr:uncharacterized protein AGABI1DRAFT_132605 [Agaricus bisporus var. burnettii JB137-S8]EKM75067.1 hypothetical protein AGABI1DRAFT_132605 [Agaricus bisporus var. burnettii JB137-S8]